MTAADRLSGVLLTVTATAVLVWASNVSMGVHPSADAVLRLAWSARPERVEVCREASAEALQRLPSHMRQRVVCEGTAASYRLTVRIDGVLVADGIVRAGGMRGDRRLYVLEEVPLRAADTALDVRFTRIDAVDGAMTSAAGRPATTPAADTAAAWIPAQLTYSGRLRLAPRSVTLITYDPGRRTLIAVGGAAAEVR